MHSRSINPATARDSEVQMEDVIMFNRWATITTASAVIEDYLPMLTSEISISTHMVRFRPWPIALTHLQPPCPTQTYTRADTDCNNCYPEDRQCRASTTAANQPNTCQSCLSRGRTNCDFGYRIQMRSTYVRERAAIVAWETSTQRDANLLD